MTIMKIWMFVFCLLLSGCVTTSKAVVHANKTVNLEQDPMKGDMQVGVRLEFFRDYTK